MAETLVEQIYAQVTQWPPDEQLKLAARILNRLANPGPEEEKKHSILELHGLGKGLWEGIDAQEYVDRLRSEWDHRP